MIFVRSGNRNVRGERHGGRGKAGRLYYFDNTKYFQKKYAKKIFLGLTFGAIDKRTEIFRGQFELDDNDKRRRGGRKRRTFYIEDAEE